MSATEKQKLASNPEHSVWVGASAGTGKTKILTDRVLRLLLSGVAPEKILCLTFTNAAAAEMSQRISKELSKWTIDNDKKLTKKIESLIGKKSDKTTLNIARKLFTKIIDDPETLKIQTIHSFCQYILKRFPLEAGVAPHFSIIDEKTANELISESWNRILSTSIKDEASEIKSAIESISVAIDDSSIFDTINELLRKRVRFEEIKRSHDKNGDISALIENTYKILGANIEDSEKKLTEEFFTLSKQREKNLYYLVGAFVEKGGVNEKKYAAIISKFLESPENNSLVMAFLTQKYEARQKLPTKAVAKFFSEAEEIIRFEIDNALKYMDKMKSLSTAQLTGALFHITDAILQLYKENKDYYSYLDYEDLINKTLNLLNDSEIAPWIMYKLDGGIEHILIDEAQDTSAEQWSIINAVSSEFFSGSGVNEKKRTIFVVGDDKQSIFSFQGADPKLFNEMNKFFDNIIQNAEQSFHNITLDKSFRSTEPILKIVDKIFSNESYKNAITTNLGQIEHIAHRNGHAGLVEVWQPITIDKNSQANETSWEAPTQMRIAEDNQKLLADKIAKTISKWTREKRILKSQNRPITAGDIIILLRKRDKFVDKLIRALEKENVNVAGIDRLVLTEHIAIEDLISLGNFLLLPDDDLNFACLLKSPICSFSEEKLFEIAYNRGKKTLWQSLQQKRYESEIFNNSCELLYDLLKITDFKTPFEIYSYLLETLEFRKKFIARMGQEVNDPIDEFLNLAMSFEQTHIAVMQNFLSWIKSGKTEIKRDMEQGKDEIRIMTVHGSKGLQAPIVFICDNCSSIPNLNKQKILWHDNYIFWKKNAENRNELCEEIYQKSNDAAYDEYLRLLYVALTRPEDELYVTGWKGNNPTKESWLDIVSDNIRQIDDVLEMEGGTLRMESAQEAPVKESDIIADIAQDDVKLPRFMHETLSKQPQIYNQSASGGAGYRANHSPLSQDKQHSHGNIIHKILQHITSIKSQERLKFLSDIIEHDYSQLEENIRQQIFEEVFALINAPDLEFIFNAKNARSELSATAIFNNEKYNVQIDRIIIEDNRILIIDYKTNRQVPKNKSQIDKSYINQLQIYKNIVSKIYPDKIVATAILWTANASLMMLEKEYYSADIDLRSIKT